MPVEADGFPRAGGGDGQHDRRTICSCAYRANGCGRSLDGTGAGRLGHRQIVGAGDDQREVIAAADAACVGNGKGYLQGQRLVFGQVLVGRIAGVQRPAAVVGQGKARRSGSVEAESQAVACVHVACNQLALNHAAVLDALPQRGAGDRRVIYG